MSTNRKRTFGAGWVSPANLPKGPNGRALCRWCQTEVPPRRQTFCSAACVDEWTVRTNPAHARAMVAKRDRGICALCGLDTRYLQETVDWLNRCGDDLERTDRWKLEDGRYRRETFIVRAGDPAARRALARLYAEFFGRPMSLWGWPIGQHLWEADHIVPVVEGGGECGLDGLRTLCLPCHRTVTAELRRRLAHRPAIDDRPADQPALLDVPA